MLHHSPGCSYASQAVINRGLEGYKIGRFSMTMHHDVYLGCIDRWQQRVLQQRLNTRYNAVSGLSQRCFKTLIRGAEQIGSQPLRNMLEARYASCYDAATCIATYSLLLPCFILLLPHLRHVETPIVSDGK